MACCARLRTRWQGLAIRPPSRNWISFTVNSEKSASKLRRDLKGGSLFEARPFRELVVLAGLLARKQN